MAWCIGSLTMFGAAWEALVGTPGERTGCRREPGRHLVRSLSSLPLAQQSGPHCRDTEGIGQGPPSSTGDGAATSQIIMEYLYSQALVSGTACGKAWRPQKTMFSRFWH